MQTQPQISFQEALEMIESFSEDQQQDLIDIVQKRLIENRRKQIAQNIKQAREEYKRGKIQQGSVDDIMQFCSDTKEW